MKKKSAGLRVGITGGIGSGKSTVCKIFALMGVPVYDADSWAKRLLTEDPKIVSAVKKLLGEEAYLPDGQYNRAYVSKIVFSEKDKLEALNRIVHPAVEAHSRAFHEAEIERGAAYTLREAALLVESGGYKFLDKLIVVSAPEELRIQRVMTRDNITEEAVRARLRNQLPEAEKLKLADYVIVNDGQHALIPQVVSLHRQLLSLSEKNKNNLENRD